MTRRSFSKTKRGRRLIAALACLAVFAGGLFWVYSDASEGAAAEQYTHYDYTFSAVVPFGIEEQGSEVTAKWKDGGHEVPGLFVRSAAPGPDGSVLVHVEGFLYEVGDFAGVITIACGADAQDVALAVSVSESSAGLMILVASAGGLVAGLILLSRGRRP
jgi:hypothetical protein